MTEADFITTLVVSIASSFVIFYMGYRFGRDR